MEQASPLADFQHLLAGLRPAPAGAEQLSGDPPSETNRLETLALLLAGAQGKANAAIRQPVAAVFAGAHGVARHGVSLLAPDEIGATLRQLADGTAPLNAVCLSFGLGLKVFELALEVPVFDITEGAALDGRAAAATLAFGMEALAGGTDLLVLAGLGAGGETAAEAIGAALLGGKGDEWADSVAVPRHVRLRRAEAIHKALQRNAPLRDDPLAILCRLGGRETAAMAGAIVAAATQKVPVILDGETAAAAALVLHAVNPLAIRHCILAHRLPVPKMAEAASAAGLQPLLDLGLWEGDGRAGAIAGGLARAAAAMAAVSGGRRADRSAAPA